MNRRTRKLKQNKQNKKGGKKVTKDQLAKCENFCNNTYIKKYLDKKRKTLKTSSYFKLTDSEIEKRIRETDKKGIIRDCKNNYCNSKCKICPACKPIYNKNKTNVISMCQYDDTLN